MSFIKKTFGGLSSSYYLRHLFFGAIFTTLYVMLFYSMGDKRVLTYIVLVGNTFLYPYSRFVYESVADFIFGDNVFFVNALFLLAVKFITMLLCYGFAFVIAPRGLLYLYFYHTKNKTFDE